jgi:hypothetical protein
MDTTVAEKALEKERKRQKEDRKTEATFYALPVYIY